jgi:hypothetical protein
MIYKNQFKKPAPSSPGDKCIDLLHQQFLELFSKVNATEMLAAYAQESAGNYLKLMRTYTAFNRCALAWAKFQAETVTRKGKQPIDMEEYAATCDAVMARLGFGPDADILPVQPQPQPPSTTAAPVADATAPESPGPAAVQAGDLPTPEQPATIT